MTFQEGTAAGLYRAFYISEARIADPCGAGPQAILQEACTRNSALGVTGLLLYSGAHFAQVLEGQATALTVLMTAIRRDGRHANLLEWPWTEAAARWYPAWAMGYVYDERLQDTLGRLAGAACPLPPLQPLVEGLQQQVDLFARGISR